MVTSLNEIDAPVCACCLWTYRNNISEINIINSSLWKMWTTPKNHSVWTENDFGGTDMSFATDWLGQNKTVVVVIVEKSKK